MLPLVAVAALVAAAASDQREAGREERRRRSLTLPVSKGTLPSGGLAMRDVDDSELPVTIEIDGDRVVVTSVDASAEQVVDGSGDQVVDQDDRPVTVRWATLTVTVLEDGDNPTDPSGEEREYQVLASDDDAKLLARHRSRTNLIAGKVPTDREVAEIVQYVGEKNLILWALGIEAGSGSYKVRSLSEWFDLSMIAPEEELAGYDDREASVDRDDQEDGLEALQIMGLDSWTRLTNALGFEPDVAYRTN